MKVEASPAQRADPARLSNECDIAEQGRLDRQHTEARHVAGGVTPFEHQHLHLALSMLADAVIKGAQHELFAYPPTERSIAQDASDACSAESKRRDGFKRSPSARRALLRSPVNVVKQRLRLTTVSEKLLTFTRPTA
jgi:hypothetical protein